MSTHAANDDSARGATRTPSVERTNPAACKERDALVNQLSTKAITSSTPAVTIDRLLDAPLDELIAETNVEFIQSSITDEKFFGAFVARKGKRTLVMMRAGLSDIEHNVIARYLIGQSLHMDLTPLPAPFEVEFNPLLPGIPMGGKA